MNSQLSTPNSQPPPTLRVALLTGGGDKPYALGLSNSLTTEGITLDFIGSDDLAVSELLDNPRVNFLNLRGDQSPGASPLAKALRVLIYYGRLIHYAAQAKPEIFHILWNNKFEFFDRTALMFYYRLLGKRIAFTAHNVNAGRRDANDSFLNRLSLKIQYELSDHIFVHTAEMKNELASDFNIPGKRISVIPFGLNKTVPNTSVTSADARARLGISTSDRTLLFFGNIAPYKGLHCLVAAFIEAVRQDSRYRLIIVGRPKGSEKYWNGIQEVIGRSDERDRVIQRIEYIPDEETELYFKAADVLILPYARIFQSGVLFLAYGFGLPVIAADVGSLRDEIVEGETGFIFRRGDSAALAVAIAHYFESDLFASLEDRRARIVQYAVERYSWSKVGHITTGVYAELFGASSGAGKRLRNEGRKEPSI